MMYLMVVLMKKKIIMLLLLMAVLKVSVMKLAADELVVAKLLL